MKVLIYGVGALGSVYGCLLKLKGHQVAGIDHEAVAGQIERSGVKITGIWGEHSARLDRVVSDCDQLQGQAFDLIIVTVKAYDTRAAAAQVRGLLSESTHVLLAQNGYGNFEAAREFIPEERLILARVIFGAETLGPGQSKVSVIADDVILGSPTGKIDMDYLEKIAILCNDAGIPTRASQEIMKFVWAKIIYNSALNPLGAILEVPYGKLAEVEFSRTIMDGIIEEIFTVLQAAGQETLWPDANAYRTAFYKQMVPTTALHHASMLQDIQRGRRTEIDSLNGAVIELGEGLGVATPINQVVVNILKSKEIKHLAV
jgi:2-dehydropantoate 2-reductase